jgi:sulfite reductase alpha subunit-like flavoprotein
MAKFWDFLLIEDLPKNSLSGLDFTLFGFGDSSYIKYNAMARKLCQRVVQLGAN